MISQEVVKNSVKGYLKQPSNMYLVIALSAALFIGIGYNFYKRHIVSQQMQAQKAFFEGISMYNQVMLSKLKPDEDSSGALISLEDADLAFKSGYSQNSSSTIAPFFKAYESVLQDSLGNEKVALELWEEVVKSVDTDRLSKLYKTKLALMYLNLDEQNGLERLEALASDNQNQFQDMANFYLGEYYFSKSDLKNANIYYGKAISLGSDSEWSKQAKAKLEG